ncbi:glycosyltransferase [bacterium]|nr:glycosyltransferase [bacterium]
MFHILILPSEEFVPQRNHLLGMFQYHQAQALKRAGHRVGALSIRQSLSLPMLAKAVARRLFGRSSANELGTLGLRELIRLLYHKVYRLEELLSVEEVSGIPIVRVEGFLYFPAGWRWNPWLRRGWLQAGMVAYQAYTERHGPPDLVHAHNALNAGLLARSLRARFGVPYVITEHSSQVASGQIAGSLWPNLAAAYAASSGLAVVGERLGQAIDKVLGDGSPAWEVIANILDPHFENAPWQERSLDPEPFRFVHVASLLPIKRQMDLIHAFAEAFGSDPSTATLDIAGDGPLLEQLQERVAQLNLTRRIRFHGRMGRAEVISLMDQSHCFVLSSQTETFGVVLIEALSRGLPLVATDCGGPSGIVTTQNGILCEVGAVGAIATALKTIKLEYPKYGSAEIREDALRRFGSENFIRTITEKYGRALSGPGRPILSV